VPDDLDRLMARQLDAAERACRAWMEHVIGEAQRRAPIEEGTLRATGTVEVERHATGGTVTGSFSTPYAAVQHERLDFNHPRGGQAKYLEGPFKENLPRLEPLIAAAVRSVT
jgi:hypothetical protein